MKENYFLTITGRSVQLVPYRKKFVERYHEWMQSEELLTLTASEPLSIEEEYAMQQSWRDDNNKCTFIVLTKDSEGSDSSGKFMDPDVRRMIGDVNLFLSKDENGEKCAEIDIMIAEAKYRRLGCGREAVKVMLWFARQKLGIRKVFAKINESNSPSRALFESLGFQEVNYVQAFQEFELRLDLDERSADIDGYCNDGCIASFDGDDE